MATTIKKQADATAFPQLEDFSEYQDARATFDRLTAEETELRQLMRGLEAAIAKANAAGSDRERRALARLKGEAIPVGAADTGEQLKKVVEEHGDTELAVRMAREQLDKATREASRKICVDLAPRFQALASKVAECVVALAVANRAESEFRAELERRGIVVSAPICFAAFGPVGCMGAGDHDSQGGYYLRELVQAGLLTGAESFLKPLSPELLR
jgi:hypothetical protein